MAKVPYLDRKNAPAASQPLFDRLEAERPVPTANIFLALTHSPDQLDAFLNYANSLRTSNLGPRLRELLILSIGHAVDCIYEVAHHEPYALKAGLSPEQLHAIPSAEDSGLFDEFDLAVIRFGRDFSTKGRVAPEDWTTLTSGLSMEQVVQLNLTAAWYVSGALMMRVLELELEPQYTTP